MDFPEASGRNGGRPWGRAEVLESQRTTGATMRYLAALTIGILLCACRAGTQKPLEGTWVHPGPNMESHAIELANPDRVVRKGQYELRLYYVARGTRSEGVHGILLENGEVVADSTPGRTLETDLGTLVCRGPWEDRTLLFDRSGWLPAADPPVSGDD